MEAVLGQDSGGILPALSPFLSESAHVLSLQHPTANVPAKEASSDSPALSPRSREAPGEGIAADAGLQGLGSRVDSASVRATSTRVASPPCSVAKSWLGKTKACLVSRLRNRLHVHGAGYSAADTEAGGADRTVPSTATGNRLWPRHIGKSKTWFKDEGSMSRAPRKLFGRPPWRQKTSAGSLTTVSSSVGDVLRGPTPPATPLSTYTAKRGSRMVNSQFPGGEAVRVSTPPLDENTADGRPRGFFTCTTPPAEYSRILTARVFPPPTEGARGRRSDPFQRGERRTSGSTQRYHTREWWEPIPGRPNRRAQHLPVLPTAFEFDIPEHLPSSPMCPANERHAGGGTGLCVYHGRRRKRTGSMLRDGAASHNSSPWLEEWTLGYSSSRFEE
ncbi:hypothetical protein JDV02_000226 [Purpureocillium takamizusanense]|uniref:Uncharacterized protein n=1 Tax=Purpureocillium takamizusanense TaxID=2060973 RepID=A0A9Q8Q6X9_9HYPO|nr:uncharacterized protein JDV02_000226 [Purpureocillium takamizusanense]UNI13483.1 hypothetical protein JDV02_000226 [Purpureocillium takamizusanense]